MRPTAVEGSGELDTRVLSGGRHHLHPALHELLGYIMIIYFHEVSYLIGVQWVPTHLRTEQGEAGHQRRLQFPGGVHLEALPQPGRHIGEVPVVRSAEDEAEEQQSVVQLGHRREG